MKTLLLLWLFIGIAGAFVAGWLLRGFDRLNRSDRDPRDL